FVLPPGGTITYTATGAWMWPPSTIFIKEFALERIKGDPRTNFPIETRLLVVRDATTIEGYSYRWRPGGDDADLLPDASLTVDYTYLDNGVARVHTHAFPARTNAAATAPIGSCQSCHL